MVASAASSTTISSYEKVLCRSISSSSTERNTMMLSKNSMKKVRPELWKRLSARLLPIVTTNDWHILRARKLSCFPTTQRAIKSLIPTLSIKPHVRLLRLSRKRACGRSDWIRMHEMNVRGKKIFVGLSGGVDSAVSAALLKRAGALVTGVFIKGWYPPGLNCTWANERRDAMRVAARLHIPFRTLDASAEYKKSVIDYLVAEYRAGRTPNPDVMCNREVKFGAFYRYAKAQGADLIATGHYRSGEKDQSYFLWAVPKDILDETVFPVGNLEKSEVRALAKKCALPVAE